MGIGYNNGIVITWGITELELPEGSVFAEGESFLSFEVPQAIANKSFQLVFEEGNEHSISLLQKDNSTYVSVGGSVAASWICNLERGTYIAKLLHSTTKVVKEIIVKVV